MTQVSITKDQIPMELGNEVVGTLIKLLRAHGVGKHSSHEGQIVLTEFLTIDLSDGKKLVLHDGDYDDSAGIYIETPC